MNRRQLCIALAATSGLTTGCLQPEVTEEQTGEIDIEFRTEATRDYLIRVRLVDADGNTEDEFESGFPPDQQGAPSYYSAGLTNGPYTVHIGTETETERIQWTISDCPTLDVDVTVRTDGALDVTRTCTT